MANPLRARSASPPLNEVLAHWFRHCDPTRTKKPRQKAGLIISATVERDGLHEFRRLAGAMAMCPGYASSSRTGMASRLCARTRAAHGSPMGCEGANNVLPARQDEVHSTGWVDRSSSRSRRRSARHGRGSEQGAGAVRARLLRADRYQRCETRAAKPCFFPPPEANRIRTQSGVIISLLEYLILNHKGRVITLTEARSFGAPVRVRVGRRHLPAGSHGDHGECMLVRWS